jgi:hypothetical protein
MIKKTKDYPKQIAYSIQKALNYNKAVKEPNTTIKITQIEISRGLYNCGSIAIRDKVCEELGIKPWDAPFTIDVQNNDFYWQLLIRYK